jgi:hypothetical protein
MTPTFFAKQPDFRKWLQENHKKNTELLAGFIRLIVGYQVLPGLSQLMRHFALDGLTSLKVY